LQGAIVCVLADAGPRADWVLVYFAVIIGVLVLLLVLVTCVAIFAKDAERRKMCHAMFRDLLMFFSRIFGRRDKR
jgi:hypothetical protein